jgi:hypothetical protein
VALVNSFCSCHNEASYNNIPRDQKGPFELAIQLRAFCYSAVCNTATDTSFDSYLTGNQQRQNCRLCMYKNQR